MRIRPITLLIFIFSFSGALNAQVWTLDKDQAYINLSYSTSAYDAKYDSAGNTSSLPVDVSNQTIELFAQYGITDKLTGQLKVPFKLLTTTGELTQFNSLPDVYLETGSLNFFGNAEAGLIYKFIDDKPMVSASFFVEGNTTDRNYLTGLQTGFNSWSFKPGIGVGWSYPKSWLSFYLGGDIRSNNYSSSILSQLEIGYKPVPYIYLAGDIYVKRSLDNGEGDCDCTAIYTALYLNNQEYVAYSLKGGFNYKEFGINVGYGSAFSANNIQLAGVLTVGLEYKSLFKNAE